MRSLSPAQVLPFAESAFVGVGQCVEVDPKTGDVFLTGRSAAVQGAHELIRMVPTSGAFKRVATFQGIDVLDGASAYDAANDIMYLQLAYNVSGRISIDIYAVDVATGKAQKIVEQAQTMMGTMDFDPSSNMIYGLGFDPVTHEPSLVQFNPTAGKFTKVNDIKGYLLREGNLQSIDVKGALAAGGPA